MQCYNILTFLFLPFCAGQIHRQLDSRYELQENLHQLMVNESMKHTRIVIELSTSTTHSINLSRVFVLQNMDLVIQSASSVVAFIECTGVTVPSFSSGILFTHCNVTLNQVHFSKCGTMLPPNIEQMLDSTNSFHQVNTAALIFLYCSHVQLTAVEFNCTLGFATIAINVKCSRFNKLLISNSYLNIGTELVAGSGILAYFNNGLIQESSFSIIDAKFSNNTKTIKHSNSIAYALCITVLFAQNDHIACEATISDIMLTNNSGASSLQLLYHSNMALSQTNIDGIHLRATRCCYQCIMQSPCSSQSFAAVQVYFEYKDQYASLEVFQPLNISNALFANNYFMQLLSIHSHVVSHPVGIYLTGLIITDSSCFDQPCMLVTTTTSHDNQFVIYFLNTTISNNHQHFGASVLVFNSISKIVIQGTNSFISNTGSVFHLTHSNLHLKDEVYFKSNQALKGAAILMLGQSLVFIHDHVLGTFKNNSALLSGGAIYAERQQHTQNDNDEVLCAFQFRTTEKATDGLLHFSDNSAVVAGSSIYAEPIFSCALLDKNFTSLENFSFYSQVFTINNTSLGCHEQIYSIQEISTRAVNISVLVQVLMDNSSHQLKKIVNGLKVTKCPGEEINFVFQSLDNVGRNVQSTVKAGISALNGQQLQQKWFSPQYAHIDVPDGNDDMQSFPFTLHSHHDMETNSSFLFFVQHLQRQSHHEVYDITVFVQACPLGFELNNVTGICDCTELYQDKFTKLISHIPGGKICCSIKGKMLTKPILIDAVCTWIGSHISNSMFALSLSCPQHYCDSNPSNTLYLLRHGKFYVGTEKDINLATSALAPICAGNRRGVLCGRCKDNFTLVFGSSKCMECSDLWLLTIIVYIIAGPMIVYALFLWNLNLTSGTLNGIILFVQIGTAGMPDLLEYNILLSPNRSVALLSQFSTFLLSIMNISIGLPLCFYSNMTQIIKSGFSILFPVYMLAIIVLIGAVSKRCTKVSSHITRSSVQLMVTVLHLSFSKLLLLIFDVFAWSNIYYAENGLVRKDTVWYWDGTQKYMKNQHLYLSIITFAIIIPLILPYTIFLLLSKLLIKQFSFANRYLRPFHEAVHAPFKESKEIFFFLRLLLVIVLYIVYACYRSSNPRTFMFWSIPPMITLLVVQSFHKPFKKDSVNYLDLWIIFQLVITYSAVWYYLLPNNDDLAKAAIVISISITVIFIIFIIILIGHIILAHKSLRAMYEAYKNLMKITLSSSRISVAYNHQAETSSFSSSCTHYREPLLDDN